MTVDVEPEVVLKPQFDAKKCAAEGCTNIFTPTIGVQKFCPKHSTNKESKRRSRAREAAKEEKEAQRLASMTRDEFWEQNRRSLKPSERKRLEARTEEMLFMCDVLDDYVNGTDGTTLQDRQDTIEEVSAEVAEHGLCDLNVALIEWWPPHEKEFLDAVIARGGATEMFVKYGYIDALSSHVYSRFASKFMAVRRTNPPTVEWVTLKCVGMDCKEYLHAISKETAEMYQKKGIKPLCYRCMDLERASREQSAKTLFGAVSKETPIDAWGRVKT